MKEIIEAIRSFFHVLTPAESIAAERGAADAWRDEFNPPSAPNMRRAYDRGWWQVQCGW